MLKRLNNEDEQYFAIMRLSWQYALLRLKAQHKMGKRFSKIDRLQGLRSDLIKPEKELLTPEEKKLTKEQIIKQQYNLSAKTAWQYEQLYKHKDLLERTVQRAKKDDDLPTLRLAMTILKEESDKISNEYAINKKNKAKHDANQLKLQAQAIKDAIKFQKLNRTDATVLDDETFNVIYANPLSVNAQMSSLKEIDIPANENSVLLLWTDSSNLLEALEVINSWGFTYKDMCIWNRLTATQTGEFKGYNIYKDILYSCQKLSHGDKVQIFKMQKKLNILTGSNPIYHNDIHKKVGRNDFCPCGSGLKYKKCCLNK